MTEFQLICYCLFFLNSGNTLYTTNVYQAV